MEVSVQGEESYSCAISEVGSKQCQYRQCTESFKATLCNFPLLFEVFFLSDHSFSYYLPIHLGGTQSLINKKKVLFPAFTQDMYYAVLGGG